MTAFSSRYLPLIAVACLCIPGCDSTYTRAAATPTAEVSAMTPRATGEVPFERAWELQLPGRVERSWISNQLPELLFFQIADTHEIHCVDARSGQTLWISDTFRHSILGDACVQHIVKKGSREGEIITEDSLYIVVDDTLYCIDIASGQRVWHMVLPFAPSTGPLAIGEVGPSLRVFVGDWNNRIQVVGLLNPASGNPDHARIPFVAWQMNMPGAIVAQPAASEKVDDKVYVGDATGAVRCFKTSRDLIWETATGGAVDGGVTLRDQVLYAGNAGNALHAFNRLNGEHLGQFNLQGPVRERPFWFTGDRDRLYVWVDSPDHAIGGLVALRAQPDSVPISDDPAKYPNRVVRLGQDWHVPGATRLLGSTPLHLLLSDATASDLVWAVHRGTGKLLWTWKVSKGWPHARSTVEHLVAYQDRSDLLRSLFAVDNTGYVVAFRMYGFVPNPAQEAAGLTSRNLADKATAQLKAAEQPANKPAE